MKCISIVYIAVILLLLSFTQSHSESAPPDSTEKELKGQIESKKGKALEILITEMEIAPAIGTIGILSKYFEEEVLGFNTHGYFDIAEVEVKEVGEGTVTFKITKELTDIKVNGKKENLFKKGIPIRFIWK